MKRIVTLILLLLGFAAQARLSGPFPINPQERAFFEYLRQVAAIRFYDNVPVEPWIQCEDYPMKRTFFSASFFQFSDSTDLETNLRAFVAAFMDHARWAGISRATCAYDINHFNDCRANGRFIVTFRYQRVVYFSEGTSERSCR